MSGDSVASITLMETKALQLEDDALCVRLSPNGKLVAVALLDNTVKVCIGAFLQTRGEGDKV